MRQTNTNRVDVSISNNIAYVCLNRPKKHNALDMAMFSAIRNTIKQLKADKTIRVVILTAKGDDFCSGLDVKSVMSSPFSAIKLLWKWWPFSANLAQIVCTGWRNIPCPVIAVIQGRCWGGGLQIVLGADFRFASTDANFSIMEAKWGLIPDMGGSVILDSLAAQDKIKQLAMTAEIIDAKQALEIGLLTEICQQPLQKAEQLAEQIIENSPDAVAKIKFLYQKANNSSTASRLFRETWYQIKILMGKNQGIAIKRQAQKAQSDDNLMHYLPRK